MNDQPPAIESQLHAHRTDLLIGRVVYVPKPWTMPQFDSLDPTAEMLPPRAEVGIIGWLRQNLFSSPLNTDLALLSAYLLYLWNPG